MYFTYSLLLYYFPLFPWFSDSHIINLAMPLKKKKKVFLWKWTWGFHFIAKLNSYSFYCFNIIYQNIYSQLILLMRLIVGFYQMSADIGLFKSVGKSAALWNLVVFAIGMTGKIHSVTKKSEHSFSCPQGNLWILISENRERLAPTRESMSPQGWQWIQKCYSIL